MQGSLFDGSVLTRPHTADYAGLLSLLGRVMITYIEYIMCGVYWGERERELFILLTFYLRVLRERKRELFIPISDILQRLTHENSWNGIPILFQRTPHSVAHSVKQRTQNTQCLCLTHMFLLILLYNHDYTIAVVSSSEHDHLHSTFVVKVTWFSFFFCQTTEVSPQSS